jgi:hypothetical protein
MYVFTAVRNNKLRLPALCFIYFNKFLIASEDGALEINSQTYFYVLQHNSEKLVKLTKISFEIIPVRTF